MLQKRPAVQIDEAFTNQLEGMEERKSSKSDHNSTITLTKKISVKQKKMLLRSSNKKLNKKTNGALKGLTVYSLMRFYASPISFKQLNGINKSENLMSAQTWSSP